MLAVLQSVFLYPPPCVLATNKCLPLSLDVFGFFKCIYLCTGTDSIHPSAPVLALNQGSAAHVEGDLCDFSYELLSQLLGILRGKNINIESHMYVRTYVTKLISSTTSSFEFMIRW